jgi:hypothetical protein
MTNEILVLNDPTTFSDFKDTYDDLVENNMFEDIVLVDCDTLNNIIQLLEKIYANNLMLLFILSCASSLYICSARRKKDYIMINNVEPKLLKGTVITNV